MINSFFNAQIREPLLRVFLLFRLLHPLPNLVKVTKGHNRGSNRNPERTLCQNRAVCNCFARWGVRVETQLREFLVRFRIVSEECIFILSQHTGLVNSQQHICLSYWNLIKQGNQGISILQKLILKPHQTWRKIGTVRFSPLQDDTNS